VYLFLQNLEVAAIDEEDNLILIKGAVPGPRSGWVLISDAVKRKEPDDAPKPLAVVASNDKSADTAATEAPAEEAAPQEAAGE